MTNVYNIWMICLELNWFVYDPSSMLHLSEFVWTLRSLVLVVLNNFLLIDATERSKIVSDQKRFFIALSLYPIHFSRTLPLNTLQYCFIGVFLYPLLSVCHCSYNCYFTFLFPNNYCCVLLITLVQITRKIVLGFSNRMKTAWWCTKYKKTSLSFCIDGNTDKTLSKIWLILNCLICKKTIFLKVMLDEILSFFEWLLSKAKNGLLTLNSSTF